MRYLHCILLLVALLGISGCATHYYMTRVECDRELGGAVWVMSKGKTHRGIIFSENRQTMPAPYNFKTRFTPAPLDVETADKVLRENINPIISQAKLSGANVNLKNKNSLKNYRRQYIGGINELGERQILMVLSHKSNVLPTDDDTKIYPARNGGDSYITALINLDTHRLDASSIGK